MDDDEPLESLETSYPDTALGTLTRQRDELLTAAEQDDGLARIYSERAQSSRDRAAQLQVAIDAMPASPL